MNINTENITDDYILSLIQTDIVRLPKRIINKNGEKLYLNNVIDLKSSGEIFDYVDNDKIYKLIDDKGDVLKEPIILDLITIGNLNILSEDKLTFEDIALYNTTYDESVECLIDRPFVEIIKLTKDGIELDVTKCEVSDNKETFKHEDLKNGDSILIEYKYNNIPYNEKNSIYYSSNVNHSSVEELKDADLNNLKDINTYYISEINIENIKNLPEEFNDECYLYILNTKENEVSQLIKSINTGDKYIRYCKNDEWFPWSKELGEVVADRLKGAIRLVGDIEGEASFVEGVTTVNTKSSKLVSRYEIVRGDDLNNLTKTGMYGSDGQVSIKNKPSDEVNYFTLNVINRQNQEESTTCSQLLINTENNEVWSRTKHNNGWSKWNCDSINITNLTTSLNDIISKYNDLENRIKELEAAAELKEEK